MNLTLQIFILLFSAIFHEVGHGYVAYRLGDPTAKNLNRLSFNPMVHIDLYMTIIMPLVLILSGLPAFGGAKPVPVNPYRFRGVSPRKGMMLVALGGPLVNFALALIALLLIHVSHALGLPDFCNIFLFYTLFINMILGAFNMIPIPPLDGSRVLAAFLPIDKANSYMKLERYGLFIIFGLILIGAIEPVLVFVQKFIFSIIPYDFAIFILNYFSNTLS